MPSTVWPDPYRGTESFDIWLKFFNVCAISNEWDDDKKLAKLPALLRGNAFLVYDALPDATKASFRLLTKALKDEFVPTENQHLYLSDFRCRRQNAGENPDEFAADLVALLERAMPKAVVTDEKSRDILLREQFILGSSEEIQRELTLKNPATFENIF